MMGIITTVEGVERFLVNRPPNMLVCDGCGAERTLERHTFSQELDQYREQGWMINNGWHGEDKGDLCPKCKRFADILNEAFSHE